MMNKFLIFLSLILLITIACSIPASEQKQPSAVRQQNTAKGIKGTPDGMGKVCFPANARIRLADGRSVRMDQLVLGPQGGDATGWGLYSEPANVVYGGSLEDDDDDDEEDDDDNDNNGPGLTIV